MPQQEIILETQRLYFKQFQPELAPYFYELNNDSEVLRFTGDLPFKSIAEAEEFLANYHEYEKHGFGRWAVFLKDQNKFIGWCGLKRHENNEVDLGFRLLKSFWGQGFASEAAEGCIYYAFHTLKLSYLIGRVMHENIASQRVLEKVGMRYWKEIICDEHPAMCYRLDHPSNTNESW